MDIPTGHPSSLSPNAHHLAPLSNSASSPSPLSPHHNINDTIQKQVNPTHLPLIVNHNLISHQSSSSPPNSSSSTLLLLSNSSAITSVSSIPSNYNSPSSHMAVASPRQDSPLDNTHLYQPNSPLSLMHSHSSSINQHASSLDSKPTIVSDGGHTISNNQHLQHYHHHSSSNNIALHLSPRSSSVHDHLSNPSTPTTELPSTPTPSSLFAKSIIRTTYG